MTDFYALKRYRGEPQGWNWGLIGGVAFCLLFWYVLIFKGMAVWHGLVALRKGLMDLL